MSAVVGRLPWMARLGLGAAVALVGLIAAANAYVLANSSASTSSVADAPAAEVAIVPGALVEPDGTMSTMLADRVRGALALWREGKVERILVSGDHGGWDYDEPGTMRAALVSAGVPARAVFTDHAGFDTWETMQRARYVFGVRDAIVVTQGFHIDRALYLADAAGIDATGLSTDLHPYGAQGIRSDAREALSRVKAVADVTFGTGATDGPPVPIEGDGRGSWGPEPPTGTPPAGARGHWPVSPHRSGVAVPAPQKRQRVDRVTALVPAGRGPQLEMQVAAAG